MANPEPPPTVTVKWDSSQELPIAIADQLNWRTIADRCYLTFGQMNMPVVEGKITEIPIRPIARFVVTPEVLRIFAKLFADAAAQFPDPKKSDTK